MSHQDSYLEMCGSGKPIVCVYPWSSVVKVKLYPEAVFKTQLKIFWHVFSWEVGSVFLCWHLGGFITALTNRVWQKWHYVASEFGHKSPHIFHLTPRRTLFGVLNSHGSLVKRRPLLPYAAARRNTFWSVVPGEAKLEFLQPRSRHVSEEPSRWLLLSTMQIFTSCSTLPNEGLRSAVLNQNSWPPEPVGIKQ